MKTRKLSVPKLIFLLFLIVAGIWIIRQKNMPAPFQKSSGTIFGTLYHITYQYESELKDSILYVLQAVDNSLSPFNPQSTITAINENRSSATDTLFREVFRLSQAVSDATGGDFDITVAPLVNAWGFGFKNRVSLNASRIDSIRQFVGYRKVALRGDSLVKQDKRIQLDCSAIAKGFGCDRVAAFLSEKGIRNYMVEIGGEVVVKGLNPDGKRWKIGINTPTEDSLNHQGLQAILSISDKAMATSGNYRNFYYQDGRKYAHTINPHTGFPVEHALLSATVLAPTCALADAYATAFMVGGMERAQKVLQADTTLQAYLIYADEKGQMATWASPALKAAIEKVSAAKAN